MMNIISLVDRGAGSGSRYLVTVFGRENEGCGFVTLKAAKAYIARFEGAMPVSAETMRSALDHYYSQFAR